MVFLYLRTSPLTNLPVIYQYYLEAIKRHTGLKSETILRVIERLSDKDWITVEEGVVWVKKELRFDPNVTTANEMHLKSIKNNILGLPRLQIVRDFLDFYKIEMPYPIASRIGYPIGYANQEKNMEKEKEKEENKEEEKSEEEKETKKDLSFSSSVSSSKGNRKTEPIKEILGKLGKDVPDPEAERRLKFEKSRERLRLQAEQVGKDEANRSSKNKSKRLPK